MSAIGIEKRSLRQVAAGLLAIAAGALIVWQAMAFARSNALATFTAHGQQRLGLYSSTIVNALDRYSYLPFLLSYDAKVRDLLSHPGDAARLQAADGWLEQANRVAGSAALYVVDPEGMAIAASNWNEPDTFVDHNYGFRPYFREALETGAGRWFGVGVVTQRPGYFLAHAVREGERLLGVVVVKVDLEPLQREWNVGGETVLVTDANNVAILASSPDWKYAVLGRLEPAAAAAIERTRQYAEAELRPLEVLRSQTIEPGVRLTTLRGRLVHGTYLVQSAEIAGEGWTIHYLTDREDILAQSRTAGFIALLAWIAAVSLFLFLRQRHLRIVAEFAAGEAVADALRKARDDLEIMVTERTADLQAEFEERRRAETELREAQAELLQAGKMAALGQMSAAIAHELNQPLTAVQTYLASTRLFAERADYDKVRENLARIDDLNRRMASITAHLKTFSRKGDGRRRPVRLAHAIDHAMSLLAANDQLDQVTIDCRVPQDATILGEETRLEQVFVNLLRNALDAMKETAEKHLSIAVEQVEDDWLIRVTDSGPGIRPEHAGQIFDPFFTTKEVGEGLGLGLSLSYRIVQDMGGAIRAENATGGGAQFIVALPVHRPAEQPKERGNV